ncbi:MAG TPA: MBL fold metallo-hydrolase [Anaerolineaceae bacterium]|nr:MBL fold metallo-hydrolase [Anaerolineaceae bacterium]
MVRVIILGSAYSIPDEKHENTHFVVLGNDRTVLVDCVSNPILRLRQAQVDFNSLTDLILTHFHPDHVSGVPLLLMDMWLMGRNKPLDIYGLHHTLDRIEDLMGFYDWEHWPNFFPVVFHRLPTGSLTTVIDSPEMRILASPVRHLIPTIGLRFEFHTAHRSMAYSCDTEPSSAVVELAAGTDILIHEATGASLGHSSPAQAGQIAREAEVGSLYLIHYPTSEFNREAWLAEARSTFPGPVILAEDFMHLEFKDHH